MTYEAQFSEYFRMTEETLARLLSDGKTVFADILSELKAKGKTVIIISHDIEFCAKNSDLCALVFDGDISAGGTAREFFSRNHFYTTAANRISRGFIRNAVTCEDVIKCLKK